MQSTASYGPKLEALFDKYSSAHPSDPPEPTTWTVEATLAWCADLGVQPDDAVMLAVAMLCKAQEMGSFDKKPWVEGWKQARQDSIDGQRAYIQSMRTELTRNPAFYRKVYGFAFEYAKEATARVLPLEMATAMWDLVLPLAPAAMFEQTSSFCFARDASGAEAAINRWKEFLSDPTGGKSRPVSKDVWNQVSTRSWLDCATFC